MNATPDQRYKFDAGKTQWDLMPWEELSDLAKLFTIGAAKYSAYSYQKVRPYKSRYFDAALRHLVDDWLIGGEEYDQETGAPHLIAAVWNLLALRWGEKHLENFNKEEENDTK